MMVTPALVRALLDKAQLMRDRLGPLPPPNADEDLELANQRTIAAQLESEIRGFTAWLEAARATPSPPATPPPGADRSPPG